MGIRATSSGNILLVGPGDPAANLDAVFTSQSWQYSAAGPPERALARLRAESSIDLILVRPGADLEPYADLCRYIKLEPSTALVSVIFVVDEGDTERRTAVFEAGADDCIQLPAEPNEIVARLRKAIRAKRATDSLEDAGRLVISLASAIEARDPYTGGHVERVATYAIEIAKRFDIDAEELSALRTGAMVHDIGKVSVPDQILNKPGSLTDEEMDVIKRHPAIGYDILQPLRTFRNVLPIVRWHHERPNGTGYPDGLAGDELPILARIVAVADCFDAITTDRPYRSAMPLEKCKVIVTDAAAKDDLDPDAVAALLDTLEQGAAALAGVPTVTATDAAPADADPAPAVADPAGAVAD